MPLTLTDEEVKVTRERINQIKLLGTITSQNLIAIQNSLQTALAIILEIEKTLPPLPNKEKSQ